MKLTTRTRTSLILLAVAAVLSIGSFRSNSYKQVAPCYNTPACQNTMTGTLKVVRLGFPVVYRQTANYKPAVTSTFANASVEQQSLSAQYILINIIFWFALLEGLYQMYLSFGDRKNAKRVVASTAAHSDSSVATDHKNTTPQN